MYTFLYEYGNVLLKGASSAYFREYLEFSAHNFQNDADEVDDCPGCDVEATTVPNIYVNEGRDGGQELTANAMPRTAHGNVDVMVQETVKAF